MMVMGMMTLKSRQEFKKLHASGMRALDSEKYAAALKFFEDADILASHSNNDRRRRLDALNLLAHSLWALGEYKKAEQKLVLAAKIANELELRDELAFVYSNLGRLQAAKIVKGKNVSRQPGLLAKNSLPYFTKAQKMLDGHSHLYFRFVNAQHGCLVAALAQDYKKSAQLVSEGLSIAFKKTHSYDKEQTYKLSPSGFEYFSMSAELIKLGTQNPFSREYKQKEKSARGMIK
jgi:tetratricopeptide (TPR) repeat protein